MKGDLYCKPRRYHYDTTLCFGTDGEPDYRELDVSVTFSVSWGTPETGRGYLADPYLYDPGSASVVEDVRIESIEGHPAPWSDPFCTDDELRRLIEEKLEDEHDAMILEASEREDSEAAYAQERRWEEARGKF